MDKTSDKMMKNYTKDRFFFVFFLKKWRVLRNINNLQVSTKIRVYVFQKGICVELSVITKYLPSRDICSFNQVYFGILRR